MNKYRVTVNGTAYEVEIEPIGASTSTGAMPQMTSAPAAPVQQPVAPVATPAPTAKPKPAASAKDVLAPMQGKIVSVNVTAGQAVKSGDVIAVLEAMKMENEIMANEDAVVEAVHVSAGQSVEANDCLVSLR